jgi:hypothetical protein
VYSLPPVASHNVYDVLDTDVGDHDLVADDLEVSPLDSPVPMAPLNVDEAATLAMDTLNTDGCTTLALSNSDMFGGSSNTVYLDWGNQLPAVLQSSAALDEFEATTGHLNGAIAGSHMTITHTGILRLAPGVVLPAVVCPGVAANLNDPQHRRCSRSRPRVRRARYPDQ